MNGDEWREEKARLRAAMRAKRRTLHADRQAMDAQAVFARIRQHESYVTAKRVMAYAAVRGELSLQAVMDAVLASGRTLLLPRCEAGGRMTARRVRGLDELVPGLYGIREPAAQSEVFAPEQIDLVLVPGTAFDRAGGRIGQGGGYYDRFLPQTRAFRMGVCHDFALFERLPQAACDARMDAVVTPGGMVESGRKARTEECGRLPVF